MAANLRFNWIFKLGCFSMVALIGLGARYGHRGKLDEEGISYFNKAQLYHVINNVGLFTSCLVSAKSIPFKIAVGGFILGTLIFVAPLYYMAVKGRNQYLAKTMPVGGLAMIVSWFSLMFA